MGAICLVISIVFFVLYGAEANVLTPEWRLGLAGAFLAAAFLPWGAVISRVKVVDG